MQPDTIVEYTSRFIERHKTHYAPRFVISRIEQRSRELIRQTFKNVIEEKIIKLIVFTISK